MCVTIILKNFFKNVPLIIGNNRDEFVSRNFIPPTVISESPYAVAGVDLIKGGTWLGLNEFGIVVNVLNKFKSKENFYGSDQYKSRGTLITELIKKRTIEHVVSSVRELHLGDYLPFYLVIADKEKVYFVEYDESINCVEIKDNVFIAGNLNPFDKTWIKYQKGYSFFNNIKYKELNKLINELKILLKYHSGDKNIPSTDFSVNLGDFQTTSSTLLIFKERNTEYYFANGSPVNSDYQDYSFLLSE